MACRYHPRATPAGRCKDCKSEFCQDCAIEIIRHGIVCLDCGARFARKKLRQAYWAAAIGLAFGLIISAMAISEGQWLMALWPPIVYPYFFPAVFFGFHYGGKIWFRLWSFADSFSGFPGLVASIMFLALRLTVAIYLGIFGGGIIQFFRYRKIVASQENLAAAATPRAAVPATMTASATTAASAPAGGPSVPASPASSQVAASPAATHTGGGTGNGQSCPACGAPVPPLAQFCLHCGGQIPVAHAAPLPTSVPQRRSAGTKLPMIAVVTALVIVFSVAGFLVVSQYLGSRAKTTLSPHTEEAKASLGTSPTAQPSPKTLVPSQAPGMPLDELVQQMARDDQDVKQCVDHGGVAYAANYLMAGPIDLTGRPGSALIVEATQNSEACLLCGNRRCTQWVYAVTTDGFRLMLTARGADSVSPLESFTSGYRDLQVLYPGGLNYPATKEIYKFDGESYRKSEGMLDTVPPTRPTLISPGSSNAPGTIVSTTTPTMEWSSVPGATGYGLYVSAAPYGRANLVYENETIPGDATSVVLPSGVLRGESQYRWNMRARNSAGWSEFSERLYFQMSARSEASPHTASPREYPGSRIRELLLRAEQEFERGQYKTALAYCDQALQIDPNHREAQALRAKIQKTMEILGVR